MGGAPATRPLIDLAVRAERLGYGSVWVGDSLLARPRHDPLTLLAALATVTKRVAVGHRGPAGRLPQPGDLGPATRHTRSGERRPAHRRCGDRRRPAEYPRGIRGRGRTLRWPGWASAGRFASDARAVARRAGRLERSLDASRRGAWAAAASVRWSADLGRGFASERTHEGGANRWMAAHLARRTERGGAACSKPSKAMPAMPAEPRRSALTISPAALTTAPPRPLNASTTSWPGTTTCPVRSCGGRRRASAASQRRPAEWIQGFVDAGAEHIVLRFVGDHARHLETFAELRERRGWWTKNNSRIGRIEGRHEPHLASTRTRRRDRIRLRGSSACRPRRRRGQGRATWRAIRPAVADRSPTAPTNNAAACSWPSISTSEAFAWTSTRRPASATSNGSFDGPTWWSTRFRRQRGTSPGPGSRGDSQGTAGSSRVGHDAIRPDRSICRFRG